MSCYIYRIVITYDSSRDLTHGNLKSHFTMDIGAPHHKLYRWAHHDYTHEYPNLFHFRHNMDVARRGKSTLPGAVFSAIGYVRELQDSLIRIWLERGTSVGPPVLKGIQCRRFYATGHENQGWLHKVHHKEIPKWAADTSTVNWMMLNWPAELNQSNLPYSGCSPDCDLRERFEQNNPTWNSFVAPVCVCFSQQRCAESHSVWFDQLILPGCSSVWMKHGIQYIYIYTHTHVYTDYTSCMFTRIIHIILQPHVCHEHWNQPWLGFSKWKNTCLLWTEDAVSKLFPSHPGNITRIFRLWPRSNKFPSSKAYRLGYIGCLNHNLQDLSILNYEIGLMFNYKNYLFSGYLYLNIVCLIHFTIW